MILIDNTVLSNFVLVDKLSILEEFCQEKGAVTNDVFAEFGKGVREGFFPGFNLHWLKKIDMENDKERSIFRNLNKRLGAGESSCLAVAICRGYDLLSDDMPARRIARIERVRVSGSVGVLLELIRIGRIELNSGNRILKGFIAHGYFSPLDRLDDLL